MHSTITLAVHLL